MNAPAKPRSLVSTTIAARLSSGRSTVSGCASLEYVATALTARVSARAYGVEACTRASAFWMRDAAMSSIAFVIFLVVCADLIFCV